MQFEQLTGGNYYHIYNRGNNRSNLFSIPADYEHFLGLYDKYISPVAETLAWVLMPNHLHLLVRIKENVMYKYSPTKPIADRSVDAVGWEKWFEEHKWETTDLSTFAEPARLCHSGGPDNVKDGNGNETYLLPDNVRLKELNADRACPDTSGSVTLSGLGETDLSACATPDNVNRLNDNRSNADRSVTLSGLGDADLSACTAPDNVGDGNGFNENVAFKNPVPHHHFSHLFNAYTRYYHNRTGGCGNLFERPFKRKQVDDEAYLKRIILYIHNNPVHHGFCTHPLEYSWSSYITCISEKPTKLKREAVVKLFGNNQKFKTEHLKPVETEQMDNWLDVNMDYVTGVSDLSAFEEPDNVKKVGNVERRVTAPDIVELNNKHNLNVDRLFNNDELNNNQLFNADRSNAAVGLIKLNNLPSVN